MFMKLLANIFIFIVIIISIIPADFSSTSSSEFFNGILTSEIDKNHMVQGQGNKVDNLTLMYLVTLNFFCFNMVLILVNFCLSLKTIRWMLLHTCVFGVVWLVVVGISYFSVFPGIIMANVVPCALFICPCCCFHSLFWFYFVDFYYSRKQLSRFSAIGGCMACSRIIELLGVKFSEQEQFLLCIGFLLAYIF